tara:strand:+ start:200 stop:622 length:423 start_codon:yes stop_codon:yes gene_type:complete
MDFLARREHSSYELVQKLQRRFVEVIGIESVVDELSEENLQSDARFAEAYVRYRCRRGYGPVHIRQKMREKGLSDDLVSKYLYSDLSLNWANLAKVVKEKKFGSIIVSDYKAKAKQIRFLQHRGFDSETVFLTVEGRIID